MSQKFTPTCRPSISIKIEGGFMMRSVMLYAKKNILFSFSNPFHLSRLPLPWRWRQDSLLHAESNEPCDYIFFITTASDNELSIPFALKTKPINAAAYCLNLHRLKLSEHFSGWWVAPNYWPEVLYPPTTLPSSAGYRVGSLWWRL